jgi:hypothetical protein
MRFPIATGLQIWQKRITQTGETEMALYTFNTDFGQGLVEAKDEEEARRKAIRDAGSFAYRGNIQKATKADLAWREAMGGTTA